jgi:hypothetical protein
MLKVIRSQNANWQASTVERRDVIEEPLLRAPGIPHRARESKIKPTSRVATAPVERTTSVESEAFDGPSLPSGFNQSSTSKHTRPLSIPNEAHPELPICGEASSNVLHMYMSWQGNSGVSSSSSQVQKPKCKDCIVLLQSMDRLRKMQSAKASSEPTKPDSGPKLVPAASRSSETEQMGPVPHRRYRPFHPQVPHQPANPARSHESPFCSQLGLVQELQSKASSTSHATKHSISEDSPRSLDPDATSMLQHHSCTDPALLQRYQATTTQYPSAWCGREREAHSKGTASLPCGPVLTARDPQPCRCRVSPVQGLIPSMPPRAEPQCEAGRLSECPAPAFSQPQQPICESLRSDPYSTSIPLAMQPRSFQQSVQLNEAAQHARHVYPQHATATHPAEHSRTTQPPADRIRDNWVSTSSTYGFHGQKYMEDAIHVNGISQRPVAIPPFAEHKATRPPTTTQEDLEKAMENLWRKEGMDCAGSYSRRS